MKLRSLGAVLSVSVAAGALIAGMAVPAGAVTTKSCGSIGFPRSDVGAFDIRATGTSWATAGAVAVGSKGRKGAAYNTLAFRCPKAVTPPPTPPGLPNHKYTCKRASGATVKFVATW